MGLEIVMNVKRTGHSKVYAGQHPLLTIKYENTAQYIV